MSLSDLFGPEIITEEIRAAARRRILNGGNLATLDELDLAAAKLILLVVREINPLEHLSREERAILMGINKETVTKMDQEKRFVHVVNH